MTDGELPTDFARERNKRFQGHRSFLATKTILGIQLASGWSADTNLGSWRLAWTHGWGLWPQQGCPGPRCCGTGVTQELLKIHVWLPGVSTVTGGLAISAYLWDCCYHLPACLCSSTAAIPLVWNQKNPNIAVLAFFSTTPGLTHPPVTSSLYICYIFWTACPSHASHTNDTSNHENTRIFKDCHDYSLDTGIVPFPTLLAA